MNIVDLLWFTSITIFICQYYSMCPYKIKLPCIKALMWFSSKTPMAAFGVAKICPFLSHAAPAVSHTICRKKRGESDKPNWTYICDATSGAIYCHRFQNLKGHHWGWRFGHDFFCPKSIQLLQIFCIPYTSDWYAMHLDLAFVRFLWDNLSQQLRWGWHFVWNLLPPTQQLYSNCSI